jgi:ribosomal protein S27AE
MNATCPRCGTVTLVSSQATRFVCKTCGLRFCRECRHWKLDRKQSYCASCGASFSVPPPAMPARLMAAVLYLPLLTAIFLAPLIRLHFAQVALIIVLAPLTYTSIYLTAFYRRTGLARAVRREAILLARRTLTLATVVYIVMMLGDRAVLITGAAVAVAAVLLGLAAQRSNASVIDELASHRPVWEAVLSMSGRDALLLRFPDARTIRRGAR